MSWDFEELRDMLASHSGMSVAFHGSLAKEMVTKLVETHKPATRYRKMLQGVLVDGSVTQREKDELARIRQNLDVNEQTHEAAVKAAGWTIQEFEQGYHHGKSRQEYGKLAERVLRDGKVDDEGRRILREHRMKHGMHPLHHVSVLEHLGWTFDEFEAGKRSEGTSA